MARAAEGGVREGRERVGALSHAPPLPVGRLALDAHRRGGRALGADRNGHPGAVHLEPQQTGRAHHRAHQRRRVRQPAGRLQRQRALRCRRFSYCGRART